MPVKNYVNLNGRTVAEHTGGVRTGYLTDALGSITATVNSSQTVVNTYRWKPYGERLAKTGAGADPTLGWVGTYGYRRTQRSRSEYYMIARHYDSIGGRWTTVDPLWPWESAYGYAQAGPTFNTDRLGLGVKPPPRPWPKPVPLFEPIPPPGPISCTRAWNQFVFRYCLWCSERGGHNCQLLCNLYASTYYKMCKKPDRRFLPRENWVPKWGPGGVVIAPEPPPPPPYQLRAGPVPHCLSRPDESIGPTPEQQQQEIFDCLSGAIRWVKHQRWWDLGACLVCCGRSFNPLRCKDACDNFRFGLTIQTDTELVNSFHEWVKQEK